jgi:hypothetical protein
MKIEIQELKPVVELLTNLSEKSNIEIEYICDDDQVYFYSRSNYYMVCVPHSGNDFTWLFRKGRKVGFDRWANSCTEEQFYKTLDELLIRLRKIKRGIN